LLDDIIQVLESIENGGLKDEGVQDQLIDKVKKQISNQGDEPLPSTEWAQLAPETPDRKERYSSYYDVPLRMESTNRWSMFGVVEDSIQELDSLSNKDMVVGIKEDTINPYLYGVNKRTGKTVDLRVGDYVGSLEASRPLFSVFWSYYSAWMFKLVIDAIDSMLTHVAGIFHWQ